MLRLGSCRKVGVKEMSKPFRADDDFIVIYQGKWYRFPTLDEADKFYEEQGGR